MPDSDMTDIVARLRAEIAWEPEVGELLSGAADEIERLRLTDAERRAIHWAATMMEVGSLPNSLNRDDAEKLRSLLERMKLGNVTRN